MHGHPSKTGIAGRGKQSSETKERASAPPKRRSPLWSTEGNLEAALPASLEPEHSRARCDKSTKAQSSRPVTRKLRGGPLRNKSQGHVVKRVNFAPGPLTAPAGGPDGHPVAEGRIAKPVRIRDGRFTRGVTVTKKDVQELELPDLLGNEQYHHSITKLKIRVGLLPSSAPARPHVSRPMKVAGKQTKRRNAAVADMGTSSGGASSSSSGTIGGRRKRRCGDS
ncbi:hypothetical protein Vafri_20726 [Volvox africanus]|uniref:Uncharacterized protein n=1 Tax=Volvox africanus TaxID=51714 RepID=A0A8J4BXI9_9CHLO|nr:hypothetical protein Vafri_20726 [Volvox africanus]